MIALVTGGATRLGAAIAARLARDGYDLAIHTHHATPLEPELVAAIAGSGVQAHVFTADLAGDSATTDLFAAIADRFGRPPRLLVNSASLLTEGGWRDVTRADLRHHLEVNTVAPVMLLQALAAGLREGERGAVIHILDQRIVNPPIDQAAYTASKLALASLTRVTARAFAPTVRVCGVAPGLTIPGPDYGPGQVDRLARRMPLERLPQPSQIADAVAYLAGAEAVTGQVLFVDGGAMLDSHARDFVHMSDG